MLRRCYEETALVEFQLSWLLQLFVLCAFTRFVQHFAVMWDHILQLEEFDSDGDVVVDESPHVSTTTSLLLPKS